MAKAEQEDILWIQPFISKGTGLWHTEAMIRVFGPVCSCGLGRGPTSPVPKFIVEPKTQPNGIPEEEINRQLAVYSKYRPN